MNTNAKNRARIAAMRTTNQVRNALQYANNWAWEATGGGNSRYAPPSRNDWSKHNRYVAMLERRLWALQGAERHAARAPTRARKVFRNYAHILRARIYRPSNAGGAMFRRMASRTNVGKKRTRGVGTSVSPKRRSPKRRSAGTSP